MRSRLVHEWRGVVGGWYFVPFQTRRKPQRQDFGVRLKSCRLNLRSPGQSSIYRNPSIVFPRGLLLFRLSSFSRWLPSTSPWLSSATAKHVAAKAPKLLPFSTFILTVGPWNVYGTRKLTAAKSKDRGHVFGDGFGILSQEKIVWEAARVSRSKCSFPPARILRRCFCQHHNLANICFLRKFILIVFYMHTFTARCWIIFLFAKFKIFLFCIMYLHVRIYKWCCTHVKYEDKNSYNYLIIVRFSVKQLILKKSIANVSRDVDNFFARNSKFLVYITYLYMFANL